MTVKRADEFHQGDSYLLDNTVYTIIGVRPPDEKNQMINFISERLVGSVTQPQFPYDTELEVINLDEYRNQS